MAQCSGRLSIMKYKILLVEDSAYKREKILLYLRELPFDIDVDEAHSFASGSQKLIHEYDFVILDISLPTYDKDNQAAGGRFRPFGGRELARKIIRRSLGTKMIFITQYESFSDKESSLTFDELGVELANECGESFLGLIHYAGSTTAWKTQLSEIIGRVMG